MAKRPVEPKPKDDGALAALPAELRWVFLHPRIQSPGKNPGRELTATDKKGAPNDAAIALLRSYVAEPASLKKMVATLLTDAVKQKAKLTLESQKASWARETQMAQARLKAELKREEREAETAVDDETTERRTISELKAIAKAFGGP